MAVAIPMMSAGQRTRRARRSRPTMIHVPVTRGGLVRDVVFAGTLTSCPTRQRRSTLSRWLDQA